MENTNWKQYFNEKAKNFGGSVQTSDYYNEKSFYIQRENTLNWLGVLKGKEVLDAGCGVGAFSETLVKDNTVYGVDFSEKSLAYAKDRGLNTLCGDLTQLPFEDGKFDHVICIGVIQLANEYEKIIRELARVTKQGGTLLIETLNKDSFLRKLLMKIDTAKKFDRMYERKELKAVYEKYGFEKVEFMNLYQPFSFVTFSDKISGIDRYLSTSFAIKGVKR